MPAPDQCSTAHNDARDDPPGHLPSKLMNAMPAHRCDETPGITPSPCHRVPSGRHLVTLSPALLPCGDLNPIDVGRVGRAVGKRMVLLPALRLTSTAWSGRRSGGRCSKIDLLGGTAIDADVGVAVDLPRYGRETLSLALAKDTAYDEFPLGGTLTLLNWSVLAAPCCRQSLRIARQTRMRCSFARPSRPAYWRGLGLVVANSAAAGADLDIVDVDRVACRRRCRR